MSTSPPKMKKLLLPLLLIVCLSRVAVTAQAQSNYEPYFFTTFAGYVGYGHADGTGSAAQFYYPFRAAADSAGNVYVADTDNHIIRKISPTGVVTTLAGLAGYSGSANGTGSAARFSFPEGIAVDNASNVYVADSNNNNIRKITPNGVVTTLAGAAGYIGSSDGVGASARFNGPFAIAVDMASNLYVADVGNFTIRKISPAGVVTTLAGMAGHSGHADGLGTDARFTVPTGVTVDSAGNVYVSDSHTRSYGGGDGNPDNGNNTIRKITPDGVVSTLAGSETYSGSADGTGSAARFFYPADVAVDNAGNVYVADSHNNTIRKITPAGVVSTLAGSHGYDGNTDGIGSAARFRSPYGVTVDFSGNVYVADTSNQAIRKITSGGVVSTLAGTSGYFGTGSTDGVANAARFYYPLGLALDNAGNVYVADNHNETIRKITSNGVVSTLAGSAGISGSADGTGNAARFNNPFHVAADSAGNIYVADTGNQTIRKITPAGVVSTFAGSAGIIGSADGMGSAARFNNPYGVALDGSGNIYVADTVNETIRKITPTGVVSTLAGLAGSIGNADGVGSAARFFAPIGVTADSAGNIYVADAQNNSIRKVTPAGAVSTLAGPGLYPQFSVPTGVAVDSVGNVYVADYGHSLIRKVTPGGIVTTLGGYLSGYADGTGSTARFSYPNGVAVDNSGVLYIADSINNTIRTGYPSTQPFSAVSRKAHGSAGIFDINLPLTGAPGIECRTGGSTNDYTVVFTFANNVSVDAAIVAAGAGSVSDVSAAGNEVTVNLTGVINAQTIVVTSYGVNDGTKKGYASAPISILVGDTTGSGAVKSSDVSQTKAQSGQAATEANFRQDVTANGVINGSDVQLVKSRVGTALPVVP